MPISFYLLTSLVTAGFVAVVLRHRYRPQTSLQDKLAVLREELEANTPEPHTIQFFGGPMDGKRQDQVHDSPFGFVQYHPNPEDEDKIQIGEVLGQPIYQPKIAYYRLMPAGVGEDTSYFYVRDVTPEEASMAESGIPPAAVVDSEE